MPTRLDKVKGALVGGVVGDMLGAPYENKPYDEVRKLLGDRPLTLPKEPKTTDDTQLTYAVLESLVACNRFDLVDVARRHVAEYDRSTNGWGGTTKSGIEEVKRWFETDGREGRDPKTPRSWVDWHTGGGNGVAMKIAPLAVFHTFAFLDEEGEASNNIVHDAMALAGLTHTDPRAGLLAACLGSGIMYLVRRNDTACTEKPATVRAHLLGKMRSVARFEPFAFRFVPHAPNPSPRPIESVHSRVLALHMMLLQGEFDAERVCSAFGTGCFAMQSVPFAIATFVRHPTNFRAAVEEAVRAGGDTDTIAAIVGTLVGANVGLEGIPAEWRANLLCADMEKQAERLALTAVGLI